VSLAAGPLRQRGIAALTAILVVAIATVLAVNLLWGTSVNLARTENLLLQDQARQFDLGGEAFARYGLEEDGRDDGPDGTDTGDEAWARPLVFEIEGGRLKGFLSDLQGRFDLNSLVKPNGERNDEAAEQFRRLLTLLQLERPLDPGTAENLVESVIDWIDRDQSPQLNGAEDDEYTGRLPPYRPANYWLTSPSELQAVRGFTPEIYAALRPHVAALPPGPEGGWKTNINTSTPEVLASLAENRTLEEVEPLVNRGFGSVQEFIEESGFDVTADRLDVKSGWFLLTVTASIGTTESTMYSLLERTGANRDVVRTRLRSFDAM
jgi:general secretion pathway protein K